MEAVAYIDINAPLVERCRLNDRQAQTELYRRLLPWSGGRSVYNFTARPDGRPADARGAFEAPVLSRLQAVKAAWDPQDLFRFTVTIPPAGSTNRAGVDSPRTGAAPLPGSA